MADVASRPVPRPTPETQHYWDGTKVGELRLQRCDDCEEVYFPPRPFCPKCSSKSVTVFAASGRGTLHFGPTSEWDIAAAQAVLEAAGSGLPRLVRVTVYLTDLGEFATLNRIYGDRLGSARPARATVGVAALPKGACVEIEAVALRDQPGL